MNRNRLLEVIVPRERQVFALLAEASANMVQAADLLDEFVHHFPDRDTARAAVLVCEQEGDRLLREIAERLGESFVAALDHGDLLNLAKAIDDVVDRLEEIADLIDLYGVGPMRHEARDLTRLVFGAARELNEAISGLARSTDYTARTTAVARFEREADEVSRSALAALFQEEQDPIEVIRWKDLFERLEDAADDGRRVATVLDAIALGRGMKR